MKKIITTLACLVFACAFLLGCGGKYTVLKETDEFIVLTPSEDYEGKKLSEFMDVIKNRGELD